MFSFVFRFFCVTLPDNRCELYPMNVFNILILMSLNNLMRIDLLIWLIGIPVLVLALIYLYIQYRQNKVLTAELSQLSKVKRNSIEYELVLKAMKLTVWHIDIPTNTITYESDYRESVGMPILSPGSSVSQFCHTLTPESEKKIHDGIMDLVEGRIEEFHEQYEMKLPHGDNHCWGEVFATVDKRDLNGKPLTIVGTSMNIDHQKDIEQALIDARIKAEESDRLKSAFLANISHEIRTPLNAIVGFSEVLPLAQSENERKELLGLIKQNNTHLLRLFDDMVNMSKLEAGGDAVRKERFSMNLLMTELVDRYSEEARKKGVKLLVEAMAGDSQPYSDRDRLREILNQYMNNALKFTDKGSVTIGYDVRGDKLRLWVRDTGRGIPEEYCNDHLFERFFKVDDFVPGTGLGLSICRSLAVSLNGTVGVESMENKGSTFWVEIALN